MILDSDHKILSGALFFLLLPIITLHQPSEAGSKLLNSVCFKSLISLLSAVFLPRDSGSSLRRKFHPTHSCERPVP